MKDTIVVDLDGTLADISGRAHLVRSDHPKFDEFYDRVGEDKVNQSVRALMFGMWMSKAKVIIVSARPQRCHKATVDWLQINSVTYTELVLVRGGEKDYRPDVELKKAWLHEYGKDRILFTVDDRQRVVDMWRSEGLTCFQVAQWEEFKRGKK